MFDRLVPETLAEAAADHLRRDGVERGAIVAWLGHNSWDMLATLVALKYCEADGRYFSLRPRALGLGLSYLNALPYWGYAQRALEDLRNDIGESCGNRAMTLGRCEPGQIGHRPDSSASRLSSF